MWTKGKQESICSALNEELSSPKEPRARTTPLLHGGTTSSPQGGSVQLPAATLRSQSAFQVRVRAEELQNRGRVRIVRWVFRRNPHLLQGQVLACKICLCPIKKGDKYTLSPQSGLFYHPFLPPFPPLTALSGLPCILPALSPSHFTPIQFFKTWISLFCPRSFQHRWDLC